MSLQSREQAAEPRPQSRSHSRGAASVSAAGPEEPREPSGRASQQLALGGGSARARGRTQAVGSAPPARAVPQRTARAFQRTLAPFSLLASWFKRKGHTQALALRPQADRSTLSQEEPGAVRTGFLAWPRPWPGPLSREPRQALGHL